MMTAFPISADDRAQRQKAVETARRSIRLEGLQVGSEGEALFDRYIAGELTRPELDNAVLALAARGG